MVLKVVKMLQVFLSEFLDLSSIGDTDRYFGKHSDLGSKRYMKEACLKELSEKKELVVFQMKKF